MKIMRNKIVVRFYDGVKPQSQEFDNIDEALEKYNELSADETIKMADLEMETVTTIKAFRR